MDAVSLADMNEVHGQAVGQHCRRDRDRRFSALRLQLRRELSAVHVHLGALNIAFHGGCLGPTGRHVLATIAGPTAGIAGCSRSRRDRPHRAAGTGARLVSARASESRRIAPHAEAAQVIGNRDAGLEPYAVDGHRDSFSLNRPGQLLSSQASLRLAVSRATAGHVSDDSDV